MERVTIWNEKNPNNFVPGQDSWYEVAAKSIPSFQRGRSDVPSTSSRPSGEWLGTGFPWCLMTYDIHLISYIIHKYIYIFNFYVYIFLCIDFFDHTKKTHLNRKLIFPNLGSGNPVSSQKGSVGVHCLSKDLETQLLYITMVETPFNATNQNLTHPASTQGIQRYSKVCSKLWDPLPPMGTLERRPSWAWASTIKATKFRTSLRPPNGGNSSEATADIWHPTTPKLSHPQRCDGCQQCANWRSRLQYMF